MASKELQSYLPKLILQAGCTSAPKDLSTNLLASFESVVLFADISGFTNLCASLEPKSNGNELLAKYLNSYFSLLIPVLNSHGGDVFKFAGDAILVLWPPSEEPLQNITRRAAQCALEINEKLRNCQVDTNVYMSIKIGIGVGRINLLHVGGVAPPNFDDDNDKAIKLEYVAVGEPLLQAFGAEHHAVSGDVIASPQAWGLLESFFEAKVKHDHAFLTKCVEPLRKISVRKQNTGGNSWLKSIGEKRSFESQVVNVARAVEYLPDSVLPFVQSENEKWASERRRITVLFVSLQIKLDTLVDVEGFSRLDRVIQVVQKCVFRYEGVVNKFMLDDKGSTLIAIFGIPAHEDDSVRGLLAATDIHTELLTKENVGSFCGVTTGNAFCGVVGGRGRREYSVLGDTVNLSARLMQHAIKNGLVCVCDNTTQYGAKEQVGLDYKDEIRVKGLTRLVKIFTLTAMRAEEAELALLNATLESKNASVKTPNKKRSLFNRFWKSHNRSSSEDKRSTHKRGDSLHLRKTPPALGKRPSPQNPRADLLKDIRKKGMLKEKRTSLMGELRTKRRTSLRSRVPSRSNKRLSALLQTAPLGKRKSTILVAPMPPLDANDEDDNENGEDMKQCILFDAEVPGLRVARVALPVNSNNLQGLMVSGKGLVTVRDLREGLKAQVKKRNITFEHSLTVDDFDLVVADTSLALIDSLPLRTLVGGIVESEDGNNPLNGTSLKFELKYHEAGDQLVTMATSILQMSLQMIVTGQLTCTYVEGAQGLGKTRLLKELIQYMPIPCVVATGSTHSDDMLQVWRFIFLQCAACLIDSTEENVIGQIDTFTCVTTEALTKLLQDTMRTHGEQVSDEQMQTKMACLGEFELQTLNLEETKESKAMSKKERRAVIFDMILLLLKCTADMLYFCIILDDVLWLNDASWNFLRRVITDSSLTSILLILASRPINRLNLGTTKRISKDCEAVLALPQISKKVLERYDDERILEVAQEAILCDWMEHVMTEKTAQHIDRLAPLPLPLRKLIISGGQGNPLVVKELMYELVVKKKYVSISGVSKTVIREHIGPKARNERAKQQHHRKTLSDTTSEITEVLSVGTISISQELQGSSFIVLVPLTLQAVLGARLDRLNYVQTMVMKCCAVADGMITYDKLRTVFPLRAALHLLDAELANLVAWNYLRKPWPHQEEWNQHRDAYYTFADGFMREMLHSLMLNEQVSRLQKAFENSAFQKTRPLWMLEQFNEVKGSLRLKSPNAMHRDRLIEQKKQFQQGMSLRQLRAEKLISPRQRNGDKPDWQQQKAATLLKYGQGQVLLESVTGDSKKDWFDCKYGLYKEGFLLYWLSKADVTNNKDEVKDTSAAASEDECLHDLDDLDVDELPAPPKSNASEQRQEEPSGVIFLHSVQIIPRTSKLCLGDVSNWVREGDFHRDCHRDFYIKIAENEPLWINALSRVVKSLDLSYIEKEEEDEAGNVHKLVMQDEEKRNHADFYTKAQRTQLESTVLSRFHANPANPNKAVIVCAELAVGKRGSSAHMNDWKTRWVVLTETEMLFSHAESSQAYDQLASLDIGTPTVSKLPTQENCIQVNVFFWIKSSKCHWEERSYVIRCKSEQQCAVWADRIDSVILKLKMSRIEDLQREQRAKLADTRAKVLEMVKKPMTRKSLSRITYLLAREKSDEPK